MHAVVCKSSLQHFGVNGIDQTEDANISMRALVRKLMLEHLGIDGVNQNILSLQGLPHSLSNALQGDQPLLNVVKMKILLLLRNLPVLQHTGAVKSCMISC